MPFCRHGFFPLPLTSARVLVACVPRRSLAFCRVTDSQMRSVFTRPPNTSSRTSTDPTFWFCELTTSTVMVASQPALGSWLWAAVPGARAKAESPKPEAYFFGFTLPLVGASACGLGSGLAAIALRMST